MIRTIAATIILGLGVCACGPQRPAIDPALESGVTSSNGGGQRALKNLNQIDIGPTGAQSGPSNQTGRAY